MAEAAPIGFVLGTKPASSLEFYVLVDQHNYLEMDDVVFVRSAVEGYAGVEAVTFYGTVIEVQQYHEGIQFDNPHVLPVLRELAVATGRLRDCVADGGEDARRALRRDFIAEPAALFDAGELASRSHGFDRLGYLLADPAERPCLDRSCSTSCPSRPPSTWPSPQAS